MRRAMELCVHRGGGAALVEMRVHRGNDEIESVVVYFEGLP